MFDFMYSPLHTNSKHQPRTIYVFFCVFCISIWKRNGTQLHTFECSIYSMIVIKEKCNGFCTTSIVSIIFRQPNHINSHFYFQLLKWNAAYWMNQSVNSWEQEIETHEKTERDEWIATFGLNVGMLIIFFEHKINIYLSVKDFVMVEY